MVLTCRQLRRSAYVERRARPRMICMNVWLRARSLISAVALFSIATLVVSEVVAPSAVRPVLVLDIPVDFILFALTLLGVAILHQAYVAAVAGFLIYGIPAAIQQHRHWPILGWNPDPPHKKRVELRSAHITRIMLGDVS
jgi:hypothetical protein